MDISFSNLYEIPDDLMAPYLFSHRVSLTAAEELVKRPGFNSMFASWVMSFDSLTCEVVSKDEDLQRVNLYDWRGRSIADILLKLYSKVVSVKTDPLSQLALTSDSRQTEVKKKKKGLC